MAVDDFLYRSGDILQVRFRLQIYLPTCVPINTNFLYFSKKIENFFYAPTCVPINIKFLYFSKKDTCKFASGTQFSLNFFLKSGTQFSLNFKERYLQSLKLNWVPLNIKSNFSIYFSHAKGLLFCNHAFHTKKCLRYYFLI